MRMLTVVEGKNFLYEQAEGWRWCEGRVNAGGSRTDLDSGVMKLEAYCWSHFMVCVIIKAFRKGL